MSDMDKSILDKSIKEQLNWLAARGMDVRAFYRAERKGQDISDAVKRTVEFTIKELEAEVGED